MWPQRLGIRLLLVPAASGVLGVFMLLPLLYRQRKLGVPHASAQPPPSQLPPSPSSRATSGGWSHLVIPRRAACLELEDVRAAHRKCLDRAGLSHSPLVQLLSCARSHEKVCMQRASAVDPHCLQAAAAPPRRRLQPWRSVVFGMAVYQSDTEQRLLQAAADTWYPRLTPGADLVLMTDADDARNASAIAPSLWQAIDVSSNPSPRSTVYVYRCAECRGKRRSCSNSAESSTCKGVGEGWLARRKVLHLFLAIHRRFGANPAKQYFLKLDPDTVPVPHNVLRLLTELRGIFGEEQPTYFGMAACRVASFALCHGAGGAMYGLSRAALGLLAKYITRQYPDFLDRVDRYTYGGEGPKPADDPTDRPPTTPLASPLTLLRVCNRLYRCVHRCHHRLCAQEASGRYHP